MWRHNLLLVFWLTAAAGGYRADAADCGKAFNALVKRKVQEAVDGADLCSGLKTTVDYGLAKVALGVDETAKADVEQLEVCLSREAIEITGLLAVTCKTSRSAVVPVAISEDISFDARVRTSDCGVQDLNISPHGEVGKVAADLFDVNGTVGRKLDEELKKLCSGE